MNVEKKEQSKMCTVCNVFFGSESNNWMCSSCFKAANGTTSNAPKNAQKPATQSKPKPEEPSKPVQADRMKCYKCNKKVGLLGTDCKCSYTFCNLHRLPEDHECTIDYKGLGKQSLSKKVEKVASRKVSEI